MKTEYTRNKIPENLVLFMGISAIVCGIISTILLLIFDTECGLFSQAGFAALIIFGIITVVKRDSKADVLVFIQSLAISILCLSVNVSYLTSYSDMEYLYSILAVVVAILIAFFGALYLCDMAYCSIRIMRLMGIIFLLELIPMIMEVNSGLSLDEFIWYYLEVVLMLSMYGIYIVVFLHSTISDPSQSTRISSDSFKLSRLFGTGIQTYILRDDLDHITGKDVSGWKTVDNGFVHRIVYIELHGALEYERMAISELCDGRKIVSFQIVNEHTIMTKFSFELIHMSTDSDFPSCTNLRMYGRDGMFVDLTVDDNQKITDARLREENGSSRFDWITDWFS